MPIKSAQNKPAPAPAAQATPNPEPAAGDSAPARKTYPVALIYRGPHSDQAVQVLVELFGAETGRRMGYTPLKPGATTYTLYVCYVLDQAARDAMESLIEESKHAELFDNPPVTPNQEQLEAAIRNAGGQLPTFIPA